MMEWRITKLGNGGFKVAYGIDHKGGAEVGYRPGVTMATFFSYYEARFDTLAEAEKWIAENPNPLKTDW